jgi:farnesyl diphosphate synthase
MGLPAAKQRAAELFSDADKALDVFGQKATALRWLALHIQNRNH